MIKSGQNREQELWDLIVLNNSFAFPTTRDLP